MGGDVCDLAEGAAVTAQNVAVGTSGSWGWWERQISSWRDVPWR